MTTKAERVTALSCPFCGGVHLDWGHAPATIKSPDWKYWIFCTGCGASGPFGDLKADAIEKWNAAQRRSE